MPDLRTLIFRYFFPLRMQLQLQQCTMHMSALLVICYTKGYVLLGRCANLKKKFEHTEEYFFLCTIPMRSILGRVPFRAPPPFCFPTPPPHSVGPHLERELDDLAEPVSVGGI